MLKQRPVYTRAMLNHHIGAGVCLIFSAIGCFGLAAQDSNDSAPALSVQTGPLKIGVVGMVHGHVEGLLWNANERDDLTIVGIYEPDRGVFDRLATKYNLDPALYHDSLETMLDQSKPEAVSVMTSIKDHLSAVEACAPRGVHLLIEKPLAYSAATRPASPSCQRSTACSC